MHLVYIAKRTHMNARTFGVRKMRTRIDHTLFSSGLGVIFFSFSNQLNCIKMAIILLSGHHVMP